LPLSGVAPLPLAARVSSLPGPDGALDPPLRAARARSLDAAGAFSPIATTAISELTPLLAPSPLLPQLLEPTSPTPDPAAPPPTSLAAALSASLSSPRPRDRDSYPSAPPFSGGGGPLGGPLPGPGVSGPGGSGEGSSTTCASSGAPSVELSGQATVAGCRVTKYLGPVTLHFIKEHFGVRSEQEVGSFFLAFLLEAHAMVRAHAAARGANALVCYAATPEESQGGRNQVYHMMTVSVPHLLPVKISRAMIVGHTSANCSPTFRAHCGLKAVSTLVCCEPSEPSFDAFPFVWMFSLGEWAGGGGGAPG
jgi:hypothetical protein